MCLPRTVHLWLGSREKICLTELSYASELFLALAVSIQVQLTYRDIFTEEIFSFMRSGKHRQKKKTHQNPSGRSVGSTAVVTANLGKLTFPEATTIPSTLCATIISFLVAQRSNSAWAKSAPLVHERARIWI